MLEAFLEILDRLISLRKIRTDRRKELFGQIIEPVFNELLLVHGDYLAMFQEVHREIEKTLKKPKKHSIGLESLKNTLKEKRIQFEPIRFKLREFAKVLAEQKLQQEEKEFLNAVLQYFPIGTFKIHFSSSTHIVQKIEEYLDGGPANSSEFDDFDKLYYLSKEVQRTIDRHKEAWSDVCVTFAKLKVKIASL